MINLSDGRVDELRDRVRRMAQIWRYLLNVQLVFGFISQWMSVWLKRNEAYELEAVYHVILRHVTERMKSIICTYTYVYDV